MPHRHAMTRPAFLMLLACTAILLSGCAAIDPNALPSKIASQDTTPTKIVRPQFEPPGPAFTVVPKRSDAATGVAPSTAEATVRKTVDAYMNAWVLPGYSPDKVKSLMTPQMRERFSEGDSIATVRDWQVGRPSWEATGAAVLNIRLRITGRELPGGRTDSFDKEPIIRFRVVLLDGAWYVDEGFMGRLRKQ